MRVLYIGDIMGIGGIKAVEEVLPNLIEKHSLDFVLAQAENVTNGRGISKEDFKRLQDCGVDFFTGGNHSYDDTSIKEYLEGDRPIIAPANMDIPGKGFKVVEVQGKRILVVSILGDAMISGKMFTPDGEHHPLATIDRILEEDHDISIVNFHGELSSQKKAFGYYLDGRATIVVGDHWHIPTNDAQILPKGTAHMTDVGMTGTLHYSLGADYQQLIRLWKKGRANFAPIDQRPYTFNSVMVEIEGAKASNIMPLNFVLE